MFQEYIALIYNMNQSQPSPSHVTLPDSMEDLHELGITEGLSPFSDKHSPGNSKL